MKMDQTAETLRSKYPAKAHAAKVAAYIKGKNPTGSGGVIYLEGQKTRMIEDNDEPVPFRYPAATLEQLEHQQNNGCANGRIDNDVTSSTSLDAPSRIAI